MSVPNVEQPALARRRRRRTVDHISRTIKYILFAFNFFFWICGTAISSLMFYLLAGKEKILRDISDVLFDPLILMCAGGCIIFLVTFCGCVGALRENIHLLKAFHICLTVLLILQLLVGVALFIFYYIPSIREVFNWFPEDSLKEAVIRYRDDPDLKDFIDSIQEQFECCGVSNDELGYKDWQQNIYFNCSDGNPSAEKCGVPHSCCKLKDDEMVNTMCGYDVTEKKPSYIDHKIHTQGCLMAFGSWLERNSIIVGAISLGVIIPQAMVMSMSWTLVDQIKRQLAQWKLKDQSKC